MEVQTSLKTVLKRLRLGGILHTVRDRGAYAKSHQLSYLEFLELALQDEIDRRDQTRLARRLEGARFQESRTLEEFDWDAPITFDRDRVKELFSLAFLERKEDVIFMGPAGLPGERVGACGMPGESACPVYPRR